MAMTSETTVYACKAFQNAGGWLVPCVGLESAAAKGNAIAFGHRCDSQIH